MFDLQEELKKLPNKPGVYLMHDKDDHIIYVGKAVNLNRRVHQYFSGTGNKSPKILRMVSQIAWFETTIVDSETEALVLECNLIKEHRPRYNTMLTDDKTYPYIKVTTPEAFPRAILTRKVRRDGANYYGPFPDAGAAKDSLRLVRKLYKIRTCSRKLPEDIGKERPCLNYHIHQCDAPCKGLVTPEKYAERIAKVQDFLKGNYKEVIRYLTEKMKEAAEAMDFELAATYRDTIANVRRMDEQQKVVDHQLANRDIIACASEESDAIVQVFFIRMGRMIGREHFHVQVAEGDETKDILNDFVKQFYSGTPFLPHEILVPENLDDAYAINKWLSVRAGHKVTVLTPQRGEKHRLVELAARNAELILKQDKERERREEQRTRGAVRKLGGMIGHPDISRIEAFDISNTSGFESVGSMVVFEGGRPKRGDYRKFRIKTVMGSDDYASMDEVLSRRFAHGLREARTLDEAGVGEISGKFSSFPDLILMDGGRGQVNIAESVLGRLGLDIPVCGMVKDDNHRTRGLFWRNEELPIDKHSDEFSLITRIQDEAHRFAIEFHRDRRNKAQVHSLLDDIDGIGPVRRKALMREFRTREALEGAGLKELEAVPEMNHTAAIRVYAFFHDGEIPSDAQ